MFAPYHTSPWQPPPAMRRLRRNMDEVEETARPKSSQASFDGHHGSDEGRILGHACPQKQEECVNHQLPPCPHLVGYQSATVGCPHSYWIFAPDH